MFELTSHSGERGPGQSNLKIIFLPASEAEEILSFLSDTWQISLSDLMLELEHFFSLLHVRLVSSDFSPGVLLINVRPTPLCRGWFHFLTSVALKSSDPEMITWGRHKMHISNGKLKQRFKIKSQNDLKSNDKLDLQSIGFYTLTLKTYFILD